jgi:hypothetical protein
MVPDGKVKPVGLQGVIHSAEHDAHVGCMLSAAVEVGVVSDSSGEVHMNIHNIHNAFSSKCLQHLIRYKYILQMVCYHTALSRSLLSPPSASNSNTLPRAALQQGLVNSMKAFNVELPNIEVLKGSPLKSPALCNAIKSTTKSPILTPHRGPLPRVENTPKGRF